MKELAKSILIILPPIRLYLDDLRAVEKIFKENTEGYKITIEGYELESIEELVEIGKTKIHWLRLQAREPYIVLTLFERNADIYSHDSQVADKGIVEKIRDVVEPRKARMHNLPYWLMWSLTGLILTFLIVDLPQSLYSFPPTTTMGKILLALGVLAYVGFNVLCWSWARRLATEWYTVIHLKNRGDEKNFFSRNRDQLITILITAVLTSLGTLFVLWLTG